jgi:hypothetical protein
MVVVADKSNILLVTEPPPDFYVTFRKNFNDSRCPASATNDGDLSGFVGNGCFQRCCWFAANINKKAGAAYSLFHQRKLHGDGFPSPIAFVVYRSIVIGMVKTSTLHASFGFP